MPVLYRNTLKGCLQVLTTYEYFFSCLFLFFVCCGCSTRFDTRMFCLTINNTDKPLDCSCQYLHGSLGDICRDFSRRSYCFRGESCPFAHPIGNESKRELCIKFQKGECNRGQNCPYIHASHPNGFVIVVFFFFFFFLLRWFFRRSARGMPEISKRTVWTRKQLQLLTFTGRTWSELSSRCPVILTLSLWVHSILVIETAPYFSPYFHLFFYSNVSFWYLVHINKKNSKEYKGSVPFSSRLRPIACLFSIQITSEVSSINSLLMEVGWVRGEWEHCTHEIYQCVEIYFLSGYWNCGSTIQLIPVQMDSKEIPIRIRNRLLFFSKFRTQCLEGFSKGSFQRKSFHVHENAKDHFIQ